MPIWLIPIAPLIAAVLAGVLALIRKGEKAACFLTITGTVVSGIVAVMANADGASAKKAFVVTRFGDVGLMLGVLLLASAAGSFDYAKVVDYVGKLAIGTENYVPLFNVNTFLCLAPLLLFCGAVGKSAQFPLHVWLPDAMEGPTPVSALIHAATMVTAGVYLVARCMPLFHRAPDAQYTVAIIAGITALLAALIALTQHDLKRVMAYSTVSQLGYMFLGLGSGREELAVFGVVAAIFHLFTHAFFKALLFLASGSVMHAMGNVIDMRRFGGLRRVLPVTHWTFLCGALALSAVPPLSGFWSKDEIVTAVYEASHLEHLGAERLTYLTLFFLAMGTAFLTAFYTFRAYYRTFWGELKLPSEPQALATDHHPPVDHASGSDALAHAHESPPVMTVPLIVLAVGAVFGGLAAGQHWLGHFLPRTASYRQ